MRVSREQGCGSNCVCTRGSVHLCWGEDGLTCVCVVVCKHLYSSAMCLSAFMSMKVGLHVSVWPVGRCWAARLCHVCTCACVRGGRRVSELICSLGTRHPYPAGPHRWPCALDRLDPGLRGEAPMPRPLAGPGPFQSSPASSEAWVLAFLEAGTSGVHSSPGRR